MLQIEDLQVKLGDKEILKHIDLEIKEGETHILFGPNGSGKTTLLAYLALGELTASGLPATSTWYFHADFDEMRGSDAGRPLSWHNSSARPIRYRSLGCRRSALGGSRVRRRSTSWRAA